MTVSAHTIHAYVGDTELEVIDANLELNESWSPYVQASLTIHAPDLATVNAIDPRSKTHVRVFVEEVFGESEHVSHLTALYGGGTLAALTTAYTTKFLFALTALWFQPWNSFGVRASTRRDFYLSVRRRTIDHAAGTVSIDLASDEMYLQDYALASTLVYAPGTLSVRAAVSDALARIGAYLQAGTADGTIEANASSWLPGQSAWDYVSPLVQQAKLRLYCDEKGRFWLVSDGYTEPGQTVLTYTGTIVSGEDEIDRDGDAWFDAVVISYKWTDSLGATLTNYDFAAQPNFSKVKHLEYTTAYPGPGAAQQVLNRSLAKGRTQSVTAVSDYSVTPSQAVSVALPDTDVQTGYVSSVSWAYPADEMQVTTRGLVETPSTAWIFTPAGISWNSVSAGVSWNTYHYP